MKAPYIGVTGFMKRDETEKIFSYLSKFGRRRVMIGVLASQKTLRGLPHRRPNRYPGLEDMKEIFPYHPWGLNLIHYNTKEPETLIDQLIAVTVAAKYADGIQLNHAWPNPDVIREYKKAFFRNQFVLQVGSRAFEMIGHSPELLAGKIAREYPVVDYVLLDPSGGEGRALDPHELRRYLQELARLNLDIGLGVAGGLCAETLTALIAPIKADFPDISIDAEGKLRDAEDRLDISAAGNYLFWAEKMFEE